MLVSMGIWDKLRNELIDIVEWQADDRQTMVWRFPRAENTIKNGAKLVVRESQVAIVINEGALADQFNQPATYTLTTQNLPILATLKGWKYGFESPFKVDVYFVSMRTFTDRKWGTKNPIMLRDKELGPVRLRAFGTFSIKVLDPAVLLRNVVGTNGRFTVDDIGDQLRDMLIARFGDILGECGIPALDMAANYDQLSQFATQRIASDFEKFGLQIVTLNVENISLPPEAEAALDRRTSMGIIGDMNRYTQMQVADSLQQAANNPAGAGPVVMGVGMTMAGQALGNMTATPTAAPPPLVAAIQYYVAHNGQPTGPFDMNQLSSMVASGQLNRQSLVWKQGMPQWANVENISELASLFPPAPPPVAP